MNSLKMEVCTELKKLSNLASRFIRQHALKNNGFNLSRSQSMILGYIYEKEVNNIEVFQKDIENQFSIRRSTATESLKKLELSGLITRSVNQSDSRLKNIKLTDVALNEINNVHSNAKALATVISKDVTDKELQTLLNVLKKLENNLLERDEIC